MKNVGVVLLVVTLSLSSMVKSQGTFISNCDTYTTVAPIVCNTCLPGYTKVASGQACNKCPEGCTTCNADQVCTACSAGYYLNLASCISCGVGCTACDQTAGTCTKCVTGYGLSSSKQCVQCIANCADCSSTGVCAACANGYILNTNDQGISQCVWSPNSTNANQGATPGVITWLVVLFIVCAAIFVLLCYFLFRPSYHSGQAGTAYVPLNQKSPVVSPPPVATQPVLNTGPVISQPAYAYTSQPGFAANPYGATTRVVNPAPGTVIQGPTGVIRPAKLVHTKFALLNENLYCLSQTF